MQKKLIALAVAGVMAAPMAAQAAASAEVYGKVRMSVGVIGNDDATVGNDDSKINLESHNSRFGVRGSQDLDNGLKATYQFETEVDFDDNNSTGGGGIFDNMRNTYVGLKGEFGEVRMGRHDTPYKLVRGKQDVWSDTYGDYNAIMGDVHDLRANNAIIYMSPSMEGFQVLAGYVTDTDDDELADANNAQENDAISLAVKYNNGPLYAALAYQSISETGAVVGGNAQDEEGIKLSLGYKVGMTQLNFIWENDDNGGPNNDQDRMYFSVDHDLGNGMNILAAYTIADDRGNTPDTGASHLALGVTKAVGDKAEFYVLYTQVDNDANATYAIDGLSAAAGAPNGDKNSAAVVGVNLNFSSM